MTKNERDFLYIIKCAITGNKLTQEELDQMDLKSVYYIAKSQLLRAVLGTGLGDLKYNPALKRKLDDKIIGTTRKTIIFDQERAKITALLEKEGVFYFPLKGILINKFYDPYGIREFSDNDLFIDPKKRRTVKKIFYSLGYKKEKHQVVNHDSYVKDNLICFEMHHRLFRNSYEQLDEYLDHLPEKALKDKNKKYASHLSENDSFCYFVVHGYKHLTEGGIGAKFLTDFYLFKKNADLDFEYIKGELKRAGVYEVFYLINSIVDKIFASEGHDFTLDGVEDTLLSFILNSSAYGNVSNLVSTRKEKYKNKISYLWHRIFPSYKWCKRIHPFFAYTFIFIPLLLLGRIFKALFIVRHVAKNELKGIINS